MTAEPTNPGRQRQEAFRFVLRRATRTEHEALDSHPAFAALMKGTLGVGGYRNLMSLFHGFYHRHDALLAEACQRFGLDRSGFTYASRAGILSRDLAALGIDTSSDDSNRPSEPQGLPPITSGGDLGGMLYVLEGSMLGGGMLCRAVEGVLGQDGAAGDGYWQWCREAGGRRWAMTCDLIEDLATTEGARADMISSAKGGFDAFARWIAGWRDDTGIPTPGGVLRC